MLAGVRKTNLASKIQAMMTRHGVYEDDIDEQFIRSSQKGGQNVNKVSTCVFLSHRPSGVTVKCQEERYQGLNRLLARQRLVEKIVAAQLAQEQRTRARIHAIKVKNRKRSAAEKERLLADKKYRAQKKESRRQKQVRGSTNYC